MLHRIHLASIFVAACALNAQAAEPFKVGLILPLTGPFASTGREISAGVQSFIAEHPQAAGRKFQIILKDDGGVADNAKRIAQEMVTNERVDAIAGFGTTPIALASMPVATLGKTPMIIMGAATSGLPKKSAYVLRTSYSTQQVAGPIGEWAAKFGIKRAMTLVSDMAPGIDEEKTFALFLEKNGGKVVGSLRVPLLNPDFSPYLQRVADEKPEALYVFIPSGAGAIFMKEVVNRGLTEKGVKLVVEGGVTDDELLNQMGDEALGVVSGYHYSAAHDSDSNRAFLKAFGKVAGNMRPNFMAVGGYDGMQMLSLALAKSNGEGGLKLIEAAKGLSWESPRGPVSIDPESRDIVQNIYMRRVERVNGELYNVEFSTIEKVKDPMLFE